MIKEQAKNERNFFLTFEEQYRDFVGRISIIKNCIENNRSVREIIVSNIRKLKKLVNEYEVNFINWSTDEKRIGLCINKIKIEMINVSEGASNVDMLIDALAKTVECYNDAAERDSKKSEQVCVAELLNRVFEIFTVFHINVYACTSKQLSDISVSVRDLYMFLKYCTENSETIAKAVKPENILCVDALDSNEMAILLEKAVLSSTKVETKKKSILRICASQIDSILKSIGTGDSKAVSTAFRVLLECYLVFD